MKLRYFIHFVLVLSIVFASCTAEKTQEESAQPEETTDLDQFPAKARNMTIYEVNIRQHTPEGTFTAFAEHLPRLKELGVEILWIMPIQPIGEENRKGGLGSYYSVKDYGATNPEFGSMEEFKALVEKAHQLDLYIILDWVPNHTAWDHPWITSNPEYYAKDDEGNITYEADWTDIALLDHTSPEPRRAMIDEMKYWVEVMDIDGFRCDHAGHEIPLVFWEEAIPELNEIKNLFWLAEWDEPRMHTQFHATYKWELHHITNRISKGENTVEDLKKYMEEDLERYGAEAYRMVFTTNHDENAWGGTVFERYGDGHQANAVLMWTLKGMPMIYSGQEAGLDKRLEFFEKDTISWADPLKLRPFYTSLNALRKNNEALWSGDFGGAMEYVDAGNERVIAYTREKGDSKVSVIINLSGDEQSINIEQKLEGTDHFSGESLSLEGESALPGWSYYVLIK